jgi:hypothetical protein
LRSFPSAPVGDQGSGSAPAAAGATLPGSWSSFASIRSRQCSLSDHRGEYFHRCRSIVVIVSCRPRLGAGGLSGMAEDAPAQHPSLLGVERAAVTCGLPGSHNGHPTIHGKDGVGGRGGRRTSTKKSPSHATYSNFVPDGPA